MNTTALTQSDERQDHLCEQFPSLAEATLEDIAVGLDSGRFTAAELVKVWLGTGCGSLT